MAFSARDALYVALRDETLLNAESAHRVVQHQLNGLKQSGYEIREIAKDEDRMHEPVASELDIEMEDMLKARHSAPPPSAHGGAPPVIPPAGVYGNKVLGSATIAPWPSPPKIGVFYSRTGSTWFSVEGTNSFDRTMADENWTFMGWLELRSVPSA